MERYITNQKIKITEFTFRKRPRVYTTETPADIEIDVPVTRNPRRTGVEPSAMNTVAGVEEMPVANPVSMRPM